MKDFLSYVVLVIIFLSLFVALIWINFILLGDEQKKKKSHIYDITLVVPAHNEESSIKKTIHSIMNANYPKDKLEIIVLNDGSTDRTAEKVEELMKEYPNLKCITNKQNIGKAPSMNKALKVAKGELFGCVDADSVIDRNAIKNMLHYFSKQKVAAVISTIKVTQHKGFFPEIQRLEYHVVGLIRRIMSLIGTLHLSHGVLSLYRTEVLRKIKGFDEKTLTEDFEIAMRLKYNGYEIKMELNSVVYTNVPEHLGSFWKQRIRWYRGFLETNYKFKSMFLNKNQGIMGWFQMPLNVLTPPMLLIMFFIFAYNTMKWFFYFIYRSITIDGYLIRYISDIPSLERLLLNLNMNIFVPMLFIVVLGISTIYIATRRLNEKIRSPKALGIYLFILPTVATVMMADAFFREIFKIKKKW
jgi:biofilm PGA synthesis N-glycosyltransferase PgaC